MRCLYRNISAFADGQRGVASIEFLAVLPIMVTIMFASVDVWNLANARGRVAVAASTLADLVGASGASIDDDEMSALFGAFNIILRRDGANADVQVVVIGRNPAYASTNEPVLVKWMQTSTGATPILECRAYGSSSSAGSEITTAFGSYGLDHFVREWINPGVGGQDLVLVKVSVSYQAMLSSLIQPVTITRNAVASVRNLGGTVDGPAGGTGCLSP